MSLALEYRRADLSGVKGRKLAGVAVKYGAVAEMGRFRERIDAGAFAGSIGGRDIVALADHDQTKVLARTRSGTLRLVDTQDALRFELDVPDTAAGRDTLALAQRGDLGGMSFGFIVDDEARENGVRVVKRARLFEISVISSWPAYAGGTVEARRLAGFACSPAAAWEGDEDVLSMITPPPPADEARRRAGFPCSPAATAAPRLSALMRFLETV